MRKATLLALLATILSIGTPFFSLPAVAQADPAFSMQTIIADDQMTDSLSMTAARIQEFLSGQSGILKSYISSDGRTAAQVIYDAAQANTISPKVLLTTIQKESSMITRTSFNTSSYSGSAQYYLDWITFYGWCDSCSTGASKGFINQINATAAAFRRYLNYIASSGTTISGWGPGVTKTIPCISSDYSSGRMLCTPGTNISITPTNAATSALYTYTPHPGGNYAFWSLWRTFGFDHRRMYPDGSLLRANGKGTIYIIQNGQKRPYMNAAAFLASYSYKQVINVSLDALLQYETGTPIYFANYSLVAAPNRGVYLLVNDTRRPIKSRAALVKAGLQGKPVTKVTWDTLNLFTETTPVTDADVYPAGAVVQSKKNGMIFYVKDGVKYPVNSGEIYKNQFGNQKPIKLTAEQLDAFTWGPFVGFRDGTLVKSKTGGPVFFISSGFRLPIASMTAAKAYGFDKILKNLIRTNDKAINVHPLGQALDVDTGYVSLASN